MVVCIDRVVVLVSKSAKIEYLLMMSIMQLFLTVLWPSFYSQRLNTIVVNQLGSVKLPEAVPSQSDSWDPFFLLLIFIDTPLEDVSSQGILGFLFLLPGWLGGRYLFISKVSDPLHLCGLLVCYGRRRISPVR